MDADAGAPDIDAGELAAQVVAAYTANRRTLATAESLTGGLLGATITGVPGASVIYRGGLITYATDVKALIGGVDPQLLDRHGAVSASTAEALAHHAAAALHADVAVALTGVAGPGPQEGHDAGTVWLGWYAAGSPGSTRLRLSGDRAGIRRGSVMAALARLLDLAR